MNWLKQIFGRVAAIGAALTLGSAAPGLATPEPVSAIAPAGTTEAAHHSGPALWKVADEDTTIYIFGTVHALPKKLEWMDSTIADALGKSDELVTEIDLADAANAGSTIAGMAVLPEGQNLRDMLGPQDRKAYEAALTQLGLPVASFDRFKPWFASLTLSTLPLIRDGYTPETGVESTLSSKFALGRQRAALETMQYQLGLFDGLPMETQLSYLRQVVQGVPEMKAKLDEMIAKWLAGDADSLARLINEEDTDPLLMDKLLTQRNRNWASWIGKRLDTPGTVFMAVGAGHLAGDESVQSMLAQNGITVTRIQ
jgi:uncharacterized protein YbaP (TraB family)